MQHYLFPYNKESYCEISEWLPTLWSYLEGFDSFEIDGKVIPVQMFFSADYKMMLTVLGMKCANSYCPCIWCMSKKGNMHLKGIPRIFHDANKRDSKKKR